MQDWSLRSCALKRKLVRWDLWWNILFAEIFVVSLCLLVLYRTALISSKYPTVVGWGATETTVLNNSYYSPHLFYPGSFRRCCVCISGRRDTTSRSAVRRRTIGSKTRSKSKHHLKKKVASRWGSISGNHQEQNKSMNGIATVPSVVRLIFTAVMGKSAKWPVFAASTIIVPMSFQVVEFWTGHEYQWVSRRICLQICILDHVSSKQNQVIQFSGESDQSNCT